MTMDKANLLGSAADAGRAARREHGRRPPTATSSGFPPPRRPV